MVSKQMDDQTVLHSLFNSDTLTKLLDKDGTGLYMSQESEASTTAKPIDIPLIIKLQENFTPNFRPSMKTRTKLAQKILETVKKEDMLNAMATTAASTTKTTATTRKKTAMATSKRINSERKPAQMETGANRTLVEGTSEAERKAGTLNPQYDNKKIKSPSLEINKTEYLGTKMEGLKLQVLKGTECKDSVSNKFWNDVKLDHKKLGCKPYYDVLDVCRMSKRYHRTINFKCKGTCRKPNNNRICETVGATRNGRETVIRIKCSMDVCEGRPVSIAIIDDEYGIVKKHKKYYSIESLERGVRKAVSKSLRHGFNFIFLSCVKLLNETNREKVEQMLTLPPMIIERDRTNKKDKNIENVDTSVSQPPNINVIVLDSISRAHFQRVLPNTANLLRELNKNQDSKAKVADFELFQSLAPFTFVNVKSFMTGKQEFSSIKDRDIGFEVLFDKLRHEGYQITVQEDTCWYDKWGSILTSNRKRDKPIKSLHEKKVEWEKFNQLTSKYKINGFGLSHISCYVLEKYGRTNMFNEGPSFCCDGKPLSSHLIDHATAIHASKESSTGTKPQFTYTHINIGHESTGKRACAIDKHLKDAVSNLAQLNNTVTILWSDHGAKTTRYSIETMSGKFETYDAFLFMLFPSSVLKALGNALATAFLQNQNAVVSAVDLHVTVSALSDWRNLLGGNQSGDLGLLTDKTWRQSCKTLPVRNYSLCKCANNYRFLDLSERRAFFDVMWMAEFAIGMLNDKLNIQLQKYNKNDFTRKCRWLHGVNFRDAIYDKYSSRYVFDVLVLSKKLQVFNVQVKHRHGGLSLFHWQRTSVYQKFDSCKDKGVSLELCICSQRNEDLMETTSFNVQTIQQSSMFGVKNNASFVFKDDHCLVLIERNHQNEVASFSIANFCKRMYTLRVSNEGRKNEWRFSENLPINLTIMPKSITFSVSARRILQLAGKLKLIVTNVS